VLALQHNVPLSLREDPIGYPWDREDDIISIHYHIRTTTLVSSGVVPVSSKVALRRIDVQYMRCILLIASTLKINTIR
jgi:hypothetical protein